MMRHLESRPDQTALELLVEFQARYPGRYTLRQIHTLQKRVREWRRQAIERLVTVAPSNLLGGQSVTKLREATRHRSII